MILNLDNETYKALIEDAKTQGVASKALVAHIIKHYYFPTNQTSKDVIKEDIKLDEQKPKDKLQ